MRHIVHLAHGVIILVILLVAIAVLTLITGSADGWLTSLVNGPLAETVGERAGLRFHTQRLHVTWKSSCPVLLELNGAEVTLLNAFADHVAIETARWCGSGVILHHIVAGPSQHEHLLTTRDVRADLFNHSISAQVLSVADRAGRVMLQADKGELASHSLAVLGLAVRESRDSGEPMVRAGQIQTSSIYLPSHVNGELNLGRIAVTNLQFRWTAGSLGAEVLAALSDSGQELAGLAGRAVSSAGALLVVIRRVTYFGLLVATVLVTFLKWLASAGVGRRGVRLLISFVPALVAYGLFFLFGRVSTAAGLVVAAAALGTITAIALRQILYRRSPAWLMRWEPFVVDALAPMTLMLLLLLCALELRLPAGNPPRSILVASLDLKALNAVLESGGFRSAIDVPAANLTTLKLVLQPGRLGLETVALDRFELNGGDARAQDKAGQELARSQIQNLIAANIQVGKETEGTRPFEVKDLHLKGAVESGILAHYTRGFHWLPAEWHRPLHFQLALAASLSRNEHLQFLASTQVRSPVLDFDAAAAGNSDSIALTSLRTLKSSPLKIGAATGSISWGGGLRTTLSMRKVVGPGFSVDSSDVNAFLHVPEFTLHSRLQGADFSLSGCHTFLDSSALDVTFTEHAFSSSARISGATIRSGKEGEQNSWLEADFPNVEARASGTRAGWKSLAGAVNFRIADGGQNVFSMDRALRFSADPAEGTVTLPAQNLELQQGMTTTIPERLALTLSLAGDPRSINLDARIPQMILPDVAPLDIEINKLNLSSYWRGGNGLSLSFSSGWNRLVLPGIAKDWTLHDIGRLRLETDGTATRALFEQLDALREQAGDMHLEREHWFRAEGHAAAGTSSLMIQGLQGGGARLSAVVDTRMLRIRRGRIVESDIHAEASSIRTLDGQGNLSTAADWRSRGKSGSLAVRVPGTDGADLMNGTFLRQPGLLRFSLMKELSLARFIPEVQPFLGQAGINLSRFEIGATMLQLEGQADFAGSEWTKLAARAETAPGLLFRFTPNASPANPLEVAIGSSSKRGLRADLTASDGTARMTAELPDLAVRSNGGAEHANIDANATATLSHSTGASPLISKIRSTIAGVRAGIDGARYAFQLGSDEKAPIAWKLKLSDDVVEEPAVTVGRDRVKLRLRAEPSFVSLGRGTRLDFSSSVAADLSLHEDELILDALMRLRYDLQSESLARHRAEVNLPLLIAFGDRLQPVNAQQGPLWDSRHYSAFWDGYRPVNTLVANKDSWRGTEVALGPVEIEELSVAPPLRAAIEFSKDVVQMNLPVKGSFLYGESEGTLQSQLRWASDEAVLDAFLGWSVQDAQADALHIATRLGYRPLIRDDVGLSLAASARGVTLSRRILEAALAHPGSFNQFDRMALDLDVGSVPGSIGRLQAESDFDVKRLNDLMRQFTNAIQLASPPEAITWESARIKVLLKDGAIENSVPIVALTGVQGARNNLVQFSGAVRFFAGRDRSTPFQDIVHTLMPFDERLQ